VEAVGLLLCFVFLVFVREGRGLEHYTVDGGGERFRFVE